MKRNIVLFIVMGALAAVIGIYVSATRLAPVAPEAAVVNRLFQQTMPDEKGVPQSLASLKGQAVLVNFWAT